LDQDIFQINRSLCSEEKLALLSFIAREFNLEQLVTLAGSNFRLIAEFTYDKLVLNQTNADLIYCDFSDVSELETISVANLIKLLSKKGIICIEGLDNTKKLGQYFQDSFQPLLEVNGFSIFGRLNGERAISSMSYQVDLFRRKYYFENERKKRLQKSGNLPLVTVIILTYCHEQFIVECLNSVFSQQGNFRMRVIIIDDASLDQNVQVIRNNIAHRSNESMQIEFIENSQNCGVVKNLASSIRLAAGCDYLTFCEGDDFWSSESRIQKHIDFLLDNPKCVMSFNNIEMCSSDGGSRQIYEEQATQPLEFMSGNDLAANNLIGNFTACFYDGILARVMPEKLFEMYTVDWMLNLYCSQFGGICHLREPLSVYRQHEGGEWSSLKESNKALKLQSLIDEYNIFLDFQYNEGFEKYKRVILEWMFHRHPGKIEKFDLMILDDVFPTKYSGFRYAEFTGYLEHFPKSIALLSGATLPFLGEEPLNILVRKYQLRYPRLGNQLLNTSPFPVQFCKLLYVNFLNNAFALLPIAEEARVPFVFTLYPGGGFVLNNPDCDRKLRRIFDSPSFLKVIVTQQITYNYLVDHCLFPADKVEFIFGVVMPQESFIYPIPTDKLRWGLGKSRLDICFMAHRYTPNGEDKGYDVFLNIATLLRSMHDDIYFHVVGPYDNKTIAVNSISDRIKFHGTLNSEHLDDFFKNMDIIMSPNVSGKIYPGSFDGFPTASCTEGGLRGTAMFCLDEFNSSAGHFVDGHEVVLIKYNLEHIVNKVEFYYLNPEELRNIGECGSKRIQVLYSYEAQMKPRIKILHDLIESPFVFDDKKLRNLSHYVQPLSFSPLNVEVISIPSPILVWLKKYSPEVIKVYYRKFIKIHVRSNDVS